MAAKRRKGQTQPHDDLFKQAFGIAENARGEIQAVLPAAVLRRLDLSTLELQPGSLVDQDQVWRHADLLYKAKLAEADVYIYCVLEHQSRSDPLMMLRLLEMMVRIWRRHRERCEASGEPVLPLPGIIPLVISHTPGGWKAATQFSKLLHPAFQSAELSPYVPDFQMVLDDLSTQDNQALQERPLEAFPLLALWALRDTRTPQQIAINTVHWAKHINSLAVTPQTEEAFALIFRYIFYVTPEADMPPIRQALAQHTTAFCSGMTATELMHQDGLEQGLERGLEQGLERGLEQGLERGLEQGQRESLVRLLESKFGALGASLCASIDGADHQTLERAFEAALRATSLDEISF